ncbi:UMTA methyltransferase family protein-like protein [Karstenula rhodostoma CBS 690.94]|uniref:UMTA methyltransferase family protein-like protein n=1 Tax=Karstenula rhodostoma CBS 690.94 TaxID=1392251 RepID=A0A9P4UIB4_9PLEO|nr:UMTA methyltransferase family protein-like protein [Karstenula rhodostoma CBS 690.94]
MESGNSMENGDVPEGHRTLKSANQISNTYSQIEGGTYALKRDFNASTRLTAQHYLWKEALGFNLHPEIAVKPDWRVADVATGNGIWLLDVARSLPLSARLDGLDISLDQCPPDAWLPENVELTTWNIFEDPPEGFVGAFDVVHIRLITVAVRDNDPKPMISSLKNLLKPGGYLQWDEVDSVDWTIKCVHRSVQTDAMRRLFKQLCGTDDWKRDMVQTLNRHGFENASVYRFNYGKSMARFWNDMYFSTWEEFAKVVLKDPSGSHQLGVAAMDEVRNGSALFCPKLVWVARKL